MHHFSSFFLSFLKLWNLFVEISCEKGAQVAQFVVVQVDLVPGPLIHVAIGPQHFHHGLCASRFVHPLVYAQPQSWLHLTNKQNKTKLQIAVNSCC